MFVNTELHVYKKNNGLVLHDQWQHYVIIFILYDLDKCRWWCYHLFSISVPNNHRWWNIGQMIFGCFYRVCGERLRRSVRACTERNVQTDMKKNRNGQARRLTIKGQVVSLETKRGQRKKITTRSQSNRQLLYSKTMISSYSPIEKESKLKLFSIITSLSHTRWSN